jgi:hypothetical protein
MRHRLSVFSLAWPPDVDASRWTLLVRSNQPRLLVFRRDHEGRLRADDFPDEADVCGRAVALVDPDVVRLERERLYVSVANGVAVYVPVGPSPLPGCIRYGRLYLRRRDD